MNYPHYSHLSAALKMVSVFLTEPISARSRTTLSARSVSAADDRVRTLEAEKDHLATLTQQLEQEVHSYREVVSTLESGGKLEL